MNVPVTAAPTSGGPVGHATAGPVKKVTVTVRAGGFVGSAAFTLAVNAAAGQAAVAAVITGLGVGGSTSTAVAAHVAAIKAAGAALRAQGAPQVSAGIGDTTRNGWVGRNDGTQGGVHGDEGIAGISLAGVDDVVWMYSPYLFDAVVHPGIRLGGTLVASDGTLIVDTNPTV